MCIGPLLLRYIIWLLDDLLEVVRVSSCSQHRLRLRSAAAFSCSRIQLIALSCGGYIMAWAAMLEHALGGGGGGGGELVGV